MNAGEPRPCGSGSVCAVIVTYRSGSEVVPTYRSVEPQVGRVVIVDNGSDIGTVRVLEDLTRESDGKTGLIRNGSNLGVGAALNQGCRHAVSLGFDWVLLMDQDSVAAPEMVASLLDAWETHPDREKVSIMAPRYEAGEGVEARCYSFRGIWPKNRIFRAGGRVPRADGGHHLGKPCPDRYIRADRVFLRGVVHRFCGHGVLP